MNSGIGSSFRLHRIRHPVAHSSLRKEATNENDRSTENHDRNASRRGAARTGAQRPTARRGDLLPVGVHRGVVVLVARRRRRVRAGRRTSRGALDHVPHRRERIVLGRRPRRRTPLGERGRRDRAAIRGRVRDGRNVVRTSVPIFSLLAPPPWTTLPVLRHGGDGDRTDVVCGYLHSEDPLFDPRMRAFPSVFVVRLTEPAAQWVRASIEYALATSSDATASDAASTRLPELLLIEMLRLHLASAPSAEHG